MLRMTKTYGLQMVAAVVLMTGTAVAQNSFQRIATIPAFENENINTQTVATCMAVDNTGNRLVYTDTVQNKLGFIDITDPDGQWNGGNGRQTDRCWLQRHSRFCCRPNE